MDNRLFKSIDAAYAPITVETNAKIVLRTAGPIIMLSKDGVSSLIW